MPRYFTHYWLNRTWHHNQEIGADGQLLDHCGSNLFTQRGVSSGDVVYAVTVIEGNLYLCGKMEVAKVCGIEEAAKYLGCEPEELWKSEEHIVASAATPMRYDLIVPMRLTKQLRFLSSGIPRPLEFESANRLDRQTLRGVRELEPQSATELDNLLSLLKPIFFEVDIDEETFPEEVIEAQTYYEGATKHITVNVYERSAKARKECIAKYGASCFICGFNFQQIYGNAGEGFIHVHHLKPLSEINGRYKLDPVKDLRPVCPNCHAMIHKRIPAYSIEEVKQLLKEAKVN